MPLAMGYVANIYSSQITSCKLETHWFAKILDKANDSTNLCFASLKATVVASKSAFKAALKCTLLNHSGRGVWNICTIVSTAMGIVTSRIIKES